MLAVVSGEDCFVNPENLDPKLHSFWEGVDLHGIAMGDMI